MSDQNRPSTHTKYTLFGRSNPLLSRLGDSFFSNLPRRPGIYKMYSQINTILYVGKAKNLRKRLQQYRRVSGNERKRARLVQATHHIEFEVFDSELEALLRENKLLQELKPPYNVAKTHPERYYYLGFSREDKTLKFQLTMSCQKDQFDIISGAFKGHRLVRSGVGAMLRQLWVLGRQQHSVFGFPPVLTKNLTADYFELELSDQWSGGKKDELNKEIVSFLKGKDNQLIHRINAYAREEGLLDEFIGKLILEDLELMSRFYDRCLAQNFKMAEALDLDHHVIGQHELDDCLVRYAFQKKE